MASARPRNRHICCWNVNAAPAHAACARPPIAHPLIRSARSSRNASSTVMRSGDPGIANCSRLRTNTLHWPSSQIAASSTVLALACRGRKRRIRSVASEKKRRRLLRQEILENRGRLHGFPVEYLQVAADFVARGERAQLAAHEAPQRLLARQRGERRRVEALVAGQRREGGRPARRDRARPCRRSGS